MFEKIITQTKLKYVLYRLPLYSPNFQENQFSRCNFFNVRVLLLTTCRIRALYFGFILILGARYLQNSLRHKVGNRYFLERFEAYGTLSRPLLYGDESPPTTSKYFRSLWEEP